MRVISQQLVVAALELGCVASSTNKAQAAGEQAGRQACARNEWYLSTAATLVPETARDSFETGCCCIYLCTGKRQGAHETRSTQCSCA